MISHSRNLFVKQKFYGVLVLTWKCSVGLSTSSEDLNTKNKASLTNQLVVDHLQNTSEHISPTNLGKTVLDQQKHWSNLFHDSGIPDPDLSSKYIIKHVLEMKKAYEYDLNLKRELTEEEENQIKKLCECRLARMPVQYIIKEWDFRDLRLTMTPPVFIPRPETEQLVELVLEKAVPNATILEIGCGSGAICLSLLKSLPQAHVTAIDQSKLACQLTKKNAQLNQLTDNLKVVQSKLQDDGTLSQPLDMNHPDIIVSNPPYVPYAQLMNLEPEIKLYEDLRALEAGRDGLRVIRSLLTFASATLRSGGLMFLEVDSSHPTLIEKWLTNHPELNLQFVQSYKDFCEKDRFVVFKKL